MTVAHVSTVAFVGIEAREVDVQVHMAEATGENKTPASREPAGVCEA